MWKKDEPKLKLNTTKYQVDESTAFQLNCSVDASPSANLIEWRKYTSTGDENRADDETARYDVFSADSHLEFKPIRHTDTQSAYYVCAARNAMNDSFGVVRFGERRFRFDIDVRFKPQMNVVAKKLAVDNDQPFALSTAAPVDQKISCVCMANPKPVFNWYF